MRADQVDVSWDPGKAKWLIRIVNGEEVIRRYCSLPKNADEKAVAAAAQKTVQDEGRLDPANSHAGQTYHAGGNGGNLQVDIKSELPVTIFLARSEEWNGALQHPESLVNLQQLCTREHVVETRYSCFVPPVGMTLIIRDERYSPDHAVIAELGAVLDPNSRVERAVGAGITGIAAVVAGREAARRQVKAHDVVD